MVFEKLPGGSGQFNTWLVNGKPYPHDREFMLKQGARYRLVFRNRTDDAHPLHLHRHQFELVEINGKNTAGILKDTVVVPCYGRAVVDFVADQPGLSLPLPYPAAHGLRIQSPVPLFIAPSAFAFLSVPCLLFFLSFPQGICFSFRILSPSQRDEKQIPFGNDRKKSNYEYKGLLTNYSLFVISTGAQRSGEICGFPHLAQRARQIWGTLDS